MADLGECLRKERKKRHVSIKEISQKTGINAKLLKALEDGEFHQVPTGFYLKNFIKNYLRTVDADVNEFFAAHRGDIESHCAPQKDAALTYIPKLKYSRFKKKNFFLTFVSVLFLFGLIFAFLYINKKSVLGIWSFVFDRVELPDTCLCIEELSCRFCLDRSPVNISIDFLANCWTRVQRGGEEAVEKTYQKGEKVAMKGYELSLVIGNPAGVKFVLNGKEVSYLKNLSQPEKIEISPRNVEIILNRQ